MVSDWSVIEQRNILEGPKINLPHEVGEVISGGNQDQELVWWHLENHAEYVVISNTLLRKDNYSFVDNTEILYSDTPTNVTLPKKLRERFPDKFSYDDKMFYLAYQEMTVGAERTIYLLTERQVLKLLPDDVEGGNVGEAIQNAPGFMPSV